MYKIDYAPTFILSATDRKLVIQHLTLSLRGSPSTLERLPDARVYIFTRVRPRQGLAWIQTADGEQIATLQTST